MVDTAIKICFYYQTLSKDRIRVNHQIKSPEVRVIGAAGENIGVVSISEALRLAGEAGLDLIEISPNANPPVAKIMDFGKFQYDENKKAKVAKAKSHTIEIKTLQVKIGTGDHDLALKAKKASEWLADGQRIKIDLFLPGRAKYMDPKFLEERLQRILTLITVNHRISGKPEKSPKGMTIIVERA